MSLTTSLPSKYWFYIISNYVPDYERYRFLFVNYEFYCFIKNLEILPKTNFKKFTRQKFYFAIVNDLYFFGDSPRLNTTYLKRELKITENIILLKYLKPAAKFLFTTTKKEEILQFFKKYSLPIHHIELCDTMTFPKEIGFILQLSYRFSEKTEILWNLRNNSPLKNLRTHVYIIKKIFFYNYDELNPKQYQEIYSRMHSMPKNLANSYASVFVLKCFKNMCIVDIIMTLKERKLPQIVFL